MPAVLIIITYTWGGSDVYLYLIVNGITQEVTDGFWWNFPEMWENNEKLIRFSWSGSRIYFFLISILPSLPWYCMKHYSYFPFCKETFPCTVRIQLWGKPKLNKSHQNLVFPLLKQLPTQKLMNSLSEMWNYSDSTCCVTPSGSQSDLRELSHSNIQNTIYWRSLNNKWLDL